MVNVRGLPKWPQFIHPVGEMNIIWGRWISSGIHDKVGCQSILCWRYFFRAARAWWKMKRYSLWFNISGSTIPLQKFGLNSMIVARQSWPNGWKDRSDPFLELFNSRCWGNTFGSGKICLISSHLTSASINNLKVYITQFLIVIRYIQSEVHYTLSLKWPLNT